MEFSEKVLVVVHLQIYALYLIIQWIYQKLVELFRRYNGTAVIPSGKVRVYSIVWRYKLDPEELAKRTDFVLLSGHLDNIDILHSPHWAIYTIEKHVVLFVLLPEPIYSFNISTYPFMFVPMFEKVELCWLYLSAPDPADLAEAFKLCAVDFCTNTPLINCHGHSHAVAVAEVTYAEFIKFGQRLEKESQPKTVLYTNTARCGSTLLGKMLNRPGVSVCYGEPPSLTVLSVALGEDLMGESDIRNLLRASISCMRAHLPTGVLCILKTQSFDARLVPLCDGIPNLKHIFMFRKKALLSVERVVRRTDFHCLLMLKLYNFSPLLTRCIGTLTAGEGKWLRVLRPQTMREMAAIVLASPMSHYEKNKKFYCHPIIWFHDVINDTENVLTSVFNELGIPLSCVNDAVECKDIDSQENSFLSRQNLRHIKLPPISNSDRAMLSEYAKIMEVPEDVFETD